MHKQNADAVLVLLVNLGSPEALTARAVRCYLREFLSDRRVIDLPRFLWLLLLYGIILPFRPKKTLAMYRKIWRDDGLSPLIYFSCEQVKALREHFAAREDLEIDCAMCYGKSSIREKVLAFIARGGRKVLFIPMYPQYSSTTTAPILDKIAAVMGEIRNIPA